jgi:ketosteroid isomerase-like protein
MSTIEERLRKIEDRQALHDVLVRYCSAVDTLSDMDMLLSCFTEDAIFDLGGIGLPRFDGHAGIRGFFKQVFADMTHHAHFNSNFVVKSVNEKTASCTAYVMGMGNSRDGNSVLVYVFYMLDYMRTPSGWKISKFGETALMPLPGSLTEIHGRD